MWRSRTCEPQRWPGGNPGTSNGSGDTAHVTATALWFAGRRSAHLVVIDQAILQDVAAPALLRLRGRCCCHGLAPGSACRTHGGTAQCSDVRIVRAGQVRGKTVKEGAMLGLRRYETGRRAAVR